MSADVLEALLGAPEDPDNPLGFDAILDADERGEVFSDGERALDAYGLNAEFVPPEHGGRLHRLDGMIDVMRSVYRRDPSLGLGYGMSSFLAAVNVWAAGSPEQREHVAGVLLRNGRMACAYHELAHGNDLAGAELSAVARPGGYVLRGRKELISNIARADSFVLYARTGPGSGSRSHSQLLLDRADLPAGAVEYLPRFRTAGLRGLQLAGVRFTDCPVPGTGVLGAPGRGMETAMTSFQLTRIALPAMMTGVLDTGLRVAVRHVLDRRLRGRAAAEIPHLRAVLAGVFTDLLVCEALGTVAARAAHLLPGELSVHSAVVKFQTAKLVLDGMNRLADVLGAQGYLREGSAAIFQKLLRDVQPIGFGHAARAVCQLAILAQLPLLARRGWQDQEPAPDGLFHVGGDLPPLDVTRLRLSTGGRDRLTGSLAAAVAALPPDHDLPALGAHFTEELAAIAAAAGDPARRESAVGAGPATYELAARYARVVSAAACAGVWRAAGADTFLGRPAWLAVALRRLRTGRLQRTGPVGEPLREEVFAELVARQADGRAFGVTDRALPLSDGLRRGARA